MKDYKSIFETVKKIGVWKVAIVLIVGILLLTMEIGGQSNNDSLQNEGNGTNNYKTNDGTVEYSEEEYISKMEEKIKKMIVGMDNVKEAHVYITIEGGSRKIVLTETPYNIKNTAEKDSNGGTRTVNDEEKGYNTVYIKDEYGKEEPFVICVKMPELKGVAVALKGSVTATDEKNIIEMINALTGVGINNISVIY